MAVQRAVLRQPWQHAARKIRAAACSRPAATAPAHLARLRQPDGCLMSEAVVGFRQHADSCMRCHQLPECRIQGHQRAGGRAVGPVAGRRCVVLQAAQGGRASQAGGVLGVAATGHRRSFPAQEAKAAACSASTFTICKVCQPRNVQLRPQNLQHDRGLAARRGTRLSTDLSERPGPSKQLPVFAPLRPVFSFRAARRRLSQAAQAADARIACI